MQRRATILFLISILALILFSIFHHKIRCGYECELSDFLPKRGSPVFYDLFFWLAVFSAIAFLFHRQIRFIINWMNDENLTK